MPSHGSWCARCSSAWAEPISSCTPFGCPSSTEQNVAPARSRLRPMWDALRQPDLPFWWALGSVTFRRLELPWRCQPSLSSLGSCCCRLARRLRERTCPTERGDESLLVQQLKKGEILRQLRCFRMTTQ